MKEYTRDQLAKYVTVSITSLIQTYGVNPSVSGMKAMYEDVLKDLNTGAMERSVFNFDKEMKRLKNE